MKEFDVAKAVIKQVDPDIEVVGKKIGRLIIEECKKASIPIDSKMGNARVSSKEYLMISDRVINQVKLRLELWWVMSSLDNT